ncbi:MAG TPA: hypothetical protein VIK61_12695 [Acidimicrobiia bacterium]
MADRLEGSRTARPGTRRSRARAAVVILVAVGSAACGSASKSTGGPPSTTAPVAFPPGAVIAQVVERDGFIAPNVRARQMPSVTVLGDGSVITPAAVPAIYPGPAIAPLQQGHISPAQVARLLADARRLGLLGRPLDFGRPAVTDLGTTVVRIGDGTHAMSVQSAYALRNDLPVTGLTASQRTARRALQSFVDELQSLPRGDRVFSPRGVAVFTLTGAIPPPAQSPRPWPIATRPRAIAAGGLGCIVVKGAELAPLLGSLAQANENTPWLVGGHTLWLAFRPLVAGDEGCMA